MRLAQGLLLSVVMLAAVALATPFAAQRAETAAQHAQASHRRDALAVVIADPVTRPLVAVGGLALVAVLLLRRRRRRRVAWGYVPVDALPRRLFARLR